mgnify:FL=1
MADGEQQRHGELLILLFDLAVCVHLIHHGLDAGQAHLGAFHRRGRGQDMVAEHKACPPLLPQEPHLDGPGRVGILDQVGADVIQNAPDVLRPHGQEHILAAQLQRTGKAALLQHLHHLGQRFFKDLGETGRGIQLHHGVPGDQRVLEQIVGQLRDLPGLAVDLCQIFARLGRGLVFVVAQDLGIEQQGGQRGAQVVGHLSDQALDLGGSLSLLGLLLAQGQTQTIQTGGQPVRLVATVKRHCNYVLNNVPVKWKVQQGYEKDVKLSTSEGYECVVEATNTEDETKHFTVIAYTEDGLECATELTVAPDYVPAPSFTEEPELNIAKGVATVSYALNLNGRKDESLITWYRCTDRNGTDRLPVSVSRLNEPEYSYTLVKEDVGYYLMAAIAPKHLRCLPGEERIVVSNSPIKKGQVNITHIFETDFQNFPCKNQPQLLPGFWTIGGYKPLDTAAYDWQVVPDKDYWIYGPGMNGSHGTGLLQDQKGARLLYTPLDGSYGDMAITLNVDASKTAGQGFGSATGQYLDLYIKFDTRTLTGYALRIIRTTKYSNAVDFILMKYENGVAEAISQPVSSTCYRTNCTLTLTAKGGKLTAHASTTTPLPAPVTDPNLKLSVDLEADIASNTFGGTGIQHTGSCGESTTMLHYMKVEWE